MRREEAAQQRLALLLGEVRLGLRVGDELEREEVARAADVADDRDVAQALDAARGSSASFAAHVLEDALLLEQLEVAAADRAAHRVAAEGDAVQEARRVRARNGSAR